MWSSRVPDQNVRVSLPPLALHRRHPVRLVVRDDLDRSRLTVLFRLVLAIPHLVWLSLYASAAIVIAFVTWLFVLVLGRVPKSLHRFLANYTRYTAHLLAYLCLAADPYPGFSGDGSYPVDIEIDPPAKQRRLGAAVRLVLAIPAFMLSFALAGTAVFAALAALGAGGLVVTIAVLAWFACLVRGQMPRGMRDAAAYAIGYGAQTTAYALLVTGRYPDAMPGRADPAPELPPHPSRSGSTTSSRGRACSCSSAFRCASRISCGLRPGRRSPSPPGSSP